MKTILTVSALLFYSLLQAQTHTVLVEYWQDGTVRDTSGKVWQDCRCLMAFAQTIYKDYDAYVLEDTTITKIHEVMQSSPWIFKEAQCRNFGGRYNAILTPWEVDLIFLR